MQVQYPGVAASIDSDLQNLEMLLRYVLSPPPVPKTPQLPVSMAVLC